jgi:hypothetical protein
MNYSEFISHQKESFFGNPLETSNKLPQITDPYLRRYQMRKVLVSSAQLYLGIWWLRLVAENM